jgi:hypothetical protein
MSERMFSDRSSADEFEKLIEAWLEYHNMLERAGDLTGRTTVADGHLWAVDRIDDIVRQDPEAGWRLIMELLLRSESDYQLACLASGPLETLLAAHGQGFIDRVEHIALSNERFRETLFGVWKNEIPDDVWSRIEQAREQKGRASN